MRSPSVPAVAFCLLAILSTRGTAWAAVPGAGFQDLNDVVKYMESFKVMSNEDFAAMPAPAELAVMLLANHPEALAVRLQTVAQVMCPGEGASNERAQICGVFLSGSSGKPSSGTVTSKAVAWGTCQGYCGSQSLRACWCDGTCTAKGDCCPDFDFVCTLTDPPTAAPTPLAETCKDRCGKVSLSETCWCDKSCTDQNDCCDDIDDHCFVEETVSCALQCGKQADAAGQNDACWCDALCTDNDDCCEDIALQCPDMVPSDSLESCKDKCTENTGKCWCDTGCSEYGDCCDDISTHCPAGAEETCEGACGGQSTDSNCYCDNLCAFQGDCCSDIAVHCPEFAPEKITDGVETSNSIIHATEP